MLGAFRREVERARRRDDLPFATLLSEERIDAAMGDTRALWQGWVYTPAVTVWVFLSQCLSRDHSCRDAVSRLIGWRLAIGERACSADTGAYCTARAGLPEAACEELVRATGREAEEEAPDAWLWRGRRVRVVDGSTVTMADTPENQAAYPQLKGQAPGCGFPIARIVVVFSLSVGTVLDAAIARYEGKLTGENSLFRGLHKLLRGGDLVLADRYFSGWFDIALLLQRGVDCVLRKHQLRATDFRTGRRLGGGDHIVRWRRPPRPDWMSREQFLTMPEQLEMREVRVIVAHKGFRTKALVVVTTLLDAERYPADKIADLYRQRWQAELHLRSLKTVMQMDRLRCKEPERVRNELRMHLTAYNLIRRVMAAAAIGAGRSPWEVSFKGAMQAIDNLLPALTGRVSLEAWLEALMKTAAASPVGRRPNRYEPRLTKRRPKKYKHLRKPRAHHKNHAAQKS